MSTTANTTVEEFTPGPWEVTRYNDLQYSIYNQGTGYEERDISDEEDKANAKLIAAAPEMYAVLKELYDWSINNNVRGSIFPKLEAAIKKATE